MISNECLCGDLNVVIVPRYSSVTRDSYIGIGPGAGSHLPDEFVINTFDLDSWINAMHEGRTAVALRMPFTAEMSNWWWLYWRFYDTRIPLDCFKAYFGKETRKARHLFRVIGANQDLQYKKRDILNSQSRVRFGFT